PLRYRHSSQFDIDRRISGIVVTARTIREVHFLTGGIHMKKKIGFWKVFGKLISTHWRSHLLFPFIVALLVEPGWGWASLKYQSVGAFIFSREGLVSHLSIASIIVTYIGVALWDIHKHTKASWTNVSGEQLKVALEDVVDFFATCTIPLEQW